MRGAPTRRAGRASGAAGARARSRAPVRCCAHAEGLRIPAAAGSQGRRDDSNVRRGAGARVALRPPRPGHRSVRHCVYGTRREWDVGRARGTMTAYSMTRLLGRPLSGVEGKHAPPRVYATGPMDVPAPGPRVAIVGTRNPTVRGVDYARDLARTLAKRGAVIVSGLASGIDAVAHRAAMDAGGGTIAVIGTPLERSYPRQNAALQRRIARDHMVVSQFPPGSSVTRRNFPMRNRTMALMADASVIVEAKERSGTVHHGWEAIRLGRPLFIPSSAVRDGSLKWPGRFIDYGAMELADVKDVLHHVPSGRA